MRLRLLNLYDAISRRPNPRVKARIIKLRRKRKQKLRRFAEKHCPLDEYIGSERGYFRYVRQYRRRFRIAIFLGVIVCTLVLLHVGGVV